MSVRAVHTGTLQYLLITEALTCDVWLATFRTNHADDIRNDPGNGQSVSAIIPPGTEGVTGQLDFELHYEVEDQAAIDALVDELEAAILNGDPPTSGYGHAIGNSSTGTVAE